jgi:hemerythrin
MKLEWKEEYSVKVKEINEQHQKLFGFLNAMDELIKNNGPREEALKLIGGLNDYANYHFKTEEKYFDQFNYADSDKHKESHNSYRTKIGEFQEKINTLGDGAMTSFLFEVLDFLEDWWIGHILNEDMGYIETFTDNGLS